jgi:hypothetical protein
MSTVQCRFGAPRTAAYAYWAEGAAYRLTKLGVQLKPGAPMPEDPKESRTL